MNTNKENTITILESDWIKLKEAGFELDEIANNSIEPSHKKSSDKLFLVINKYDFVSGKELAISEWEKGFRDGANSVFNYFLDRLDMDDDFDKKYIIELDCELQGRIEITTGKNKADSVIEVDLTLNEQE